MTLASSRFLAFSTCFGCSLGLLALSACAGDPTVSFEELPVASTGGAGGSAGSMSRAGSSSRAGATSGGGSTSAGGRKGEVEEPVVAGAGAGVGGGGTGGAAAGSGGAGGSEVVIENEGGAGGQGSVTPTFDLIDDMEGAFPSLPQREGRSGGWYMIHDYSYGQATSGTVMQLNPDRPESVYAARVSGSGFTDWGAQLGATLKAGATGYDASRYCGVRFLAKGVGPRWTFLISDRNSVPQAGVCGVDGNEACYHFVGKTFEVGADWQEVQVGFSELTHVLDPANPRRLDSTAIYDILFNFHSPSGSAFELVIDDLSFIEKSEAGCLF